MFQIKKGMVTINNVTYKAFENSYNKKWYIVIGEKCNGKKVADNIEATSGKKALEKWLSEKEQGNE